jgi:hypothetical protein
VERRRVAMAKMRRKTGTFFTGTPPYRSVMLERIMKLPRTL